MWEVRSGKIEVGKFCVLNRITRFKDRQDYKKGDLIFSSIRLMLYSEE
jgi:hypothetical protein